jgi:3-oxoacyl-[acyl-carrier protein] reductase
MLDRRHKWFIGFPTCRDHRTRICHTVAIKPGLHSDGTEDTGDALQEAAAAFGGTVAIADVAETEDVDRVVAETIARTGRIDVLVNNAGFLRDSVLWKMDDDAWNDVLDVHLGGTFRFIRACAPHFRAQKYGRIINLTSFSGLHGNLGQANYAAAKAGMIGLTKTAAKELGRSGVTVNDVLPFADTGMTASIPEDSKPHWWHPSRWGVSPRPRR